MRRYTAESLKAEVLETGKDYIPKNCPGTCRNIATWPEDIERYGRMVFCRRNRAIVAKRQDKPPKMITVKEAIKIDQEAIGRYDEQIRIFLERKGVVEAEIESLKKFGCVRNPT